MNEDLQKQIEEAKAKLTEAVAEKVEQETEQPETVAEEVTEKSPESDPYLDEAIKMGYNPNYQGSNKKSPEQFVKDGSFFRKIDAQNKKIDDLVVLIKRYDEHNQKLEVAAYRKGVEDALKRRTEAVESADVEAFNRAEADLQEFKATAPVVQQQAQPAPPQYSPELIEWAQKQKDWLNQENKEIVTEADALFVVERSINPNKSDLEIAENVKSKIQKLYPDKFENPNKQKAVAVTKSSTISTGSSKQSALVGRLSNTQKQFYETAKQTGIKLSIEDYARQLDMTGDLKND